MKRSGSIKISLSPRMIIAQLASFVQEQAQGTATFGQITNMLTEQNQEECLFCRVNNRSD